MLEMKKAGTGNVSSSQMQNSIVGAASSGNGGGADWMAELSESPIDALIDQLHSPSYIEVERVLRRLVE